MRGFIVIIKLFSAAPFSAFFLRTLLFGGFFRTRLLLGGFLRSFLRGLFLGNFFRRFLSRLFRSLLRWFTRWTTSASAPTTTHRFSVWFFVDHHGLRFWFAHCWNFGLFFLFFFLFKIFFKRVAITAGITEFVSFVVTQVKGFFENHCYASSSVRRSSELHSYVAGKF